MRPRGAGRRPPRPHQQRMGQSRKAGDQGGRGQRGSPAQSHSSIPAWRYRGLGTECPGRGTGKPSPGTESCVAAASAWSWSPGDEQWPGPQGTVGASVGSRLCARLWAPSGALAARLPGDAGWGVSPQTRGACLPRPSSPSTCPRRAAPRCTGRSTWWGTIPRRSTCTTPGPTCGRR